ncbi:MAG: ORF6N domain-containing protein [Desulfobulbaceae bacterium]|nr:ORF6N domain-containing protein [Desulfobulbaceae bacterium]
MLRNIQELYNVETRVLNQAVKRNIDIFPDDFMFELTIAEWERMSSQIVMTYHSKRPKSSIPKAFTEHGVAMLSNVLKSKKARNTSVAIIRAFIAMKYLIINQTEIEEKLKLLEEKYNKQFSDVYEALNFLLNKNKLYQEQNDRRRIGFRKTD